MTKIYYGPKDTRSNSYRLVPAPTISINTEVNYGNDTIIGYTYTVTLNGYITGSRKLTEEINNQQDNIRNITKILENISIVKQIFNRNGSYLYIVDKDNNTLLECHGGTLRSIEFNESPNMWNAYTQYSAQIEFNEIKILDESVSCSLGLIDTNSLSNNLIDTTKYKIKSFTDSWNFTINDQLYRNIKNTETGSALDIENTRIDLQYTISATGKNYYIEDKLAPAWSQAKNFAQERLYNVVKAIFVGSNSSKILKYSGDESCSAEDNLTQIHNLDNPGILSDIANYKVYNETITCDTSESNGTFSLTYNAVLRKTINSSFADSGAFHTVSKNVGVSYESNNKKTISISVQGQIEGLYEGGLVRTDGSFKLPKNGTLLIGLNLANKFTNAENLLNKLIDEDDLKSSYKTTLGISAQELAVNTSGCDNIEIPPASFNLTRNYMDGTISYSAEYNSNRACAQNIASASISIDNPTPILAEFIIPGGSEGAGGVVIQDLGTKTAKKVSVTIEGKGTRKCCINNDLNTLLDKACGGIQIPSGIVLPDDNDFILTQKSRQDNIKDGSYTLNLSYICASGCNIRGPA